MRIPVFIAAVVSASVSITTATPIDLNAGANYDCHSAGPWGNVGTGSFVDILDTRENIARLARTDVCKIRALITFRVACIRGSAIYVRNLENKNTAYKCVNYKVHAEGLDREYFNQKLPWFGPAHVAGSKFAVIFVGSKC